MSDRTPPPYPNLLVIDDEPGIRDMMSLSLGADGYKVCTAADGAEGLGMFKEQKPDIVLTDIKMPGLDGIEVLKTHQVHEPGHRGDRHHRSRGHGPGGALLAAHGQRLRDQAGE